MSPTRNPEIFAGNCLRISFLYLFFIGFLVSYPSVGIEVRVETGNDFLTSNPTEDDLYSFALEIAVDRGPWTLTLQENIFTDKAAGIRFDETYARVGRQLVFGDEWYSRIEVGVVFGTEHQHVHLGYRVSLSRRGEETSGSWWKNFSPERVRISRGFP